MEVIIPCWNCQTDTKVVDFRCSICNKIQNIRKTNPYEIFNLKQCYLIDNEDLELKYYHLQNIFHPDKFINSAEKEKEISAYESSNINNAPTSSHLFFTELRYPFSGKMNPALP